jgi:hypothetical protein
MEEISSVAHARSVRYRQWWVVSQLMRANIAKPPFKIAKTLEAGWLSLPSHTACPAALPPTSTQLRCAAQDALCLVL